MKTGLPNVISHTIRLINLWVIRLEEFNDSQDAIEGVNNHTTCTIVQNGEIHIDNLTAYWPKGTKGVRLIKNNNVMCIEDFGSIVTLSAIFSLNPDFWKLELMLKTTV